VLLEHRLDVAVVRVLVMMVLVAVLVPLVAVVVLRVRMLFVDEHVNLGADERAPFDALAREPIVLHRQLVELAAHGGLGDAEIEQRAERHVAGDAGEAVEVELRANQLAHEVFLLMRDAA